MTSLESVRAAYDSLHVPYVVKQSPFRPYTYLFPIGEEGVRLDVEEMSVEEAKSQLTCLEFEADGSMVEPPSVTIGIE